VWAGGGGGGGGVGGGGAGGGGVGGGGAGGGRGSSRVGWEQGWGRIPGASLIPLHP